MDIEVGYDVDRGVYITRHETIKELYVKREEAKDIAIELRKLIGRELNAWKHNWYDAMLGFFQLEEKEHQEKEKQEEKDYKKLHEMYKKEVEKEGKGGKGLFPSRMIGDQKGEQYKRLEEFGKKYGHENSLSEYIEPKLYSKALIKWRQKMYVKFMKEYAGSERRTDGRSPRPLHAQSLL